MEGYSDDDFEEDLEEELASCSEDDGGHQKEIAPIKPAGGANQVDALLTNFDALLTSYKNSAVAPTCAPPVLEQLQLERMCGRLERCLLLPV